MKKGYIFLICFIVIVGIGVGGFFIWKSFKPSDIIIEPSGDVVTELSLAEKTDVKTVQIIDNSSSEHRIIDVKYPSIQSFTNKNFQNAVNTQITDVILAYRDEIMTMIDEKTPDTTLYTYKTSYEKYACGDYLSLVISNDYQTNGIRSNKWKDIYNINVRKENIFQLADLFMEGVNFEKAIIDEIGRQATNQNIILMNGLKIDDLSQTQKFYIKDEKLVIYFDPSEIAPTSYGELQFEMPFRLNAEGKFEI